MAALSDDLISEILVRVPVKSLLRCQSVLKTWLSIIKNPSFVNSQLRHTITNLTDQTLIINRSHCCINRSHCCENDKQVLRLHVNSRQVEDDLQLPFSRDELKSNYVYRMSFVGSANGIVCVALVLVSVNYGNVLSGVGVKNRIYLWNPAIRQSKLIPSDRTDRETLQFGFGYDEIDHDFKVFRVLSSFSAEVYSDNGNAWRKVPDPMDIPRDGHFDVCVNGFLCGIGRDGMVAFDLNKEVMNCAIKLPYILRETDARIIEFYNSVALIILTNFSDRARWTWDEMINIWTLDDDACLRGGGGEASWTPMFSIDIVLQKDIQIPSNIILSYFSNGKLLLLTLNDSYMWISFDLEKKEAKIVPFEVDRTTFYSCDVYKYTESLVSLAGFEHINW